MEWSDFDARIVTAACLVVIGFIVIGFTLKIWWTHAVNRAFLFGPYLTQSGLKLILRSCPMLFLLGALALAGGVSRFVYWLRWRGAATDELAAMIGLAEAALSLWAAGTVSMFAIKVAILWRRIKR